jgi:S-DNA-T family DNA segregation ATPase FtsK/SpoIIIE
MNDNLKIPYPFPGQGASASTRTAPKSKGGKFVLDFLGLCCLCSAVLLLFSLISFNPDDPTLNQIVRGKVYFRNWAGLIGAYLSGLLTDLLGFASYALFLFLAALSVALLRRSRNRSCWGWVAFVPLCCCMAVAGTAWGLGLGAVRSGGLLGYVLLDFSTRYFSHIGSLVIWLGAFLLAIQGIGGFTWRQAGLKLLGEIRKSLEEAAREETARTEAARSELAASHSALVSSAGEAPENGTLPLRPPAERSYPGNAGQAPEIGPFLVYADKSPSPRPPDEAALSPSANAPERSFWSRMFRLSGGEGAGMEEKAASAQQAAEADKVPGGPADEDPEHTDRVTAWMETNLFPVKDGGGTEADSAPALPPKEKQRGAASAAKAPPRLPARPSRRPPPSLPGLNLLQTATAGGSGISREELENKRQALMNCLGDFSVQAELVRITPGPVVTSFDVRPSPGVRTSRILGLSNDLARGLKAVSVRIQAPIPGTDAVGIEIPNNRREIVYLRELLESPAFASSTSPLTLALGKDSSGAPIAEDLARMPHLLVAGATGTGKSVFLNSVLMSVLYKTTPEEVRLLLIDPKRVELSAYADLPHLVHPIVTEMDLVKNALDWAVREMDERYELLRRSETKNISAYNARILELGEHRPPEWEDLRPLPYLVIVMDEFADLMLTAGKEAETRIVRLAQLARAAGIHLIIATQSPRADVITGLIKANFLCRVSFQVTSQIESRIIMDSGGAELLLGQGDMLYKRPGGRLQRLHGAYAGDAEVAAVTEHWRRQRKPDYQVDFTDSAAEAAGNDAPAESSDAEEEQLYARAVEIVREQGKASISLLQRYLRIGYNRSARLIERMEREAIIGPASGSKPRTIK